MSFDVRDKLLQRFGNDVCNTVIYENVAVAESPARKLDGFAHSPTSAGAQDCPALYGERCATGLL